jgi:ribonuclease BN (tRNA processing enzyme)
MKVTFLGTCANQTATHEGVAFIVEGREPILVDTGPGVVRQIQRAGRLCTEIGHVIVTHAHGDHTLGFPYFIWNHFYEGLGGYKGPERIHVYALPSVVAGLRSMLEFCYVTKNYPFVVEYHELASDGGGPTPIGDLSVSWLPVPHTTENIALRFDSPSASLAYSSDTIYDPGFVRFATGASFMIHEGFVTEEQFDLSRRVKHGTGADAGRAAKEAGAKSLALVHLFPPMYARVSDLVQEAKKEFDGSVFVPEELQVMEL